MGLIAQVFAALGLIACSALLLRMSLSRARQRRWDAFWRRWLEQLRKAGRALRLRWQRLRTGAAARRAAAQAIDRARGKPAASGKESNVIRPRFGKPGPKKKPPLH